MTDKQKAFVAAYLSNGLNATQAAIQVGYSPKRRVRLERGCCQMLTLEKPLTKN